MKHFWQRIEPPLPETMCWRALRPRSSARSVRSRHAPASCSIRWRPLNLLAIARKWRQRRARERRSGSHKSRSGDISQVSSWRKVAVKAPSKDGISAFQLQAKLGIGFYKTAWLLLHKLRRAMVNPNRKKLGGFDEIVEIGDTSIPFRTKDEPLRGSFLRFAARRFSDEAKDVAA
ncbi:hypothetical protein EFR01_50760 [Sinorhizobium fredii]|nr:hypothetical protein EFR01_50760 [Sinorhizobium fredii]GLS07405.1 hypothetical protein GCM10007864_10320 [Sinorhizobium fredii]